MPYLSHKVAIRAARTILRILPTYTTLHKTISERRLNMALWAFLEGAAGNIDREFKIRVTAQNQKIDFRQRTNNPVVLEFAFRPRSGGQQLEAKPNKKELNKLTRVERSVARSRILLLVDYSSRPYTKAQLLAMYKPLKSTRGKYKRHRVTVIYVAGGRQPEKLEWPK